MKYQFLLFIFERLNIYKLLSKLHLHNFKIREDIFCQNGSHPLVTVRVECEMDRVNAV